MLDRFAGLFVRYNDGDSAQHRERFWGVLFLLLVFIFSLIDIIEDSVEGVTISHLVTELSVVAVSLIGAGYLFRRLVVGLRKENVVLQKRLVEAHRDAANWRRETESLARGLGEAIDRQLISWGLSPAERDVAILLLKGLSFKELASARATSERTVRQQAASVYAKAELEGRAQLAAFFLEDILVTHQK